MVIGKNAFSGGGLGRVQKQQLTNDFHFPLLLRLLSATTIKKKISFAQSLFCSQEQSFN